VASVEAMGFKGEAVYIIEYDFVSELKIPKNTSKERRKALKLRNKTAREFRNKLIHLLKFKLMATRHLESSWLIDEKRLEDAVNGLEDLKAKMKQKGFKNVDKRIRIIPILTTVEGFQHYEDKKAEFLLDFTMEHLRYVTKGLKKRRIAKSTLWRCQHASEIVNAIKDELSTSKRYKELCDTIGILDDQIGAMEAIIAKEKEKEAQK